MDRSFDYLFAPNRPLRAYPGLMWEFERRDLNESASDLLVHLDRVFEILATESCAFITTIELDVERGRFPEVIVQHLWDETVDDSDALFVAPISGIGSCGRMSFETRPGQIARALRYNDGWRWGAYLRAWGVQVRREDIPDVIEVSPFETEAQGALSALREVSRAAWLASPDLDVLALWINPAVVPDEGPEMTRLRALTA
jgi:hypothetical protein